MNIVSLFCSVSSNCRQIPTEEKPRQEDISEKSQSEDKAKTIDRLIKLYIQQNTLLWSRLQTLSALQLAVIGGWYWLFVKSDSSSFSSSFFALLVALLGVVLSWHLRQLTDCDAGRRDYLLKKVNDIGGDEEGKVIFPDRDQIPESERNRPRGLTVMRRIMRLFLGIDVALAVVAGLKVVIWLVLHGCRLPGILKEFFVS